MKKMNNSEHIEGKVYQHSLAIKTVQNKESSNFGKSFIAGDLEVAVDDAGLNVIPVHFTYVTETTASGKKNATYTTLKRIIDEDKSWVTVGSEEAFKVKIDTALSLNDFYTQDDQLVSVKVNEGGFVSIVNELTNKNDRNTFNVDMVITNVRRVEADPERNIEEDYAVIKGAIFDFRNALLPMEFIIKNPQGIEFFEGLEVSSSQPVFTRVWGKINCETKTTVVSEETAFGEAAVRTYEKKTKEWVITGSSKSPYDFGDEAILTVEELTKAMQDREVKLAETKKRSQEYRAQKTTSAAVPASTGKAVPSSPAKPGAFSF